MLIFLCSTVLTYPHRAVSGAPHFYWYPGIRSLRSFPVIFYRAFSFPRVFSVAIAELGNGCLAPALEPNKLAVSLSMAGVQYENIDTVLRFAIYR